jgi:hypothetical protein
VGAIITFIAAMAILAFFACVLAMFAIILKLMLTFLGALCDGPTDAVIQIKYPISHPKVRPYKEVIARNENTHAAANGSFFNDVSGVDLEYRSVGVTEDRVGTAVLGKIVS